MKELVQFLMNCNPSVEKSVHVPPSNVLSPEGRAKYWTHEIMEVKTIASTYFHLVYAQEFEWAVDGMVGTLRDFVIIDDFIIAAFSELNLHFVNSHVHPDDPLDTDRGAELGLELSRRTWNTILVGRRNLRVYVTLQVPVVIRGSTAWL